jgi:hypothetical protein
MPLPGASAPRRSNGDTDPVTTTARQTSAVRQPADRTVAQVMAPLRTFEKANLDRQGFDCLDDEAQRIYALPLRFSPIVGTASVIIGLLLQSSLWLGTMALIALSGALLPRGRFIDVVYNLGVRHLFGADALPPTPTPRRFSYLLSTILLTGSTLSCHNDVPAVVYVLGGAVAIGGATLASTLWCVGSWAYNTVLRVTPRSRPHRT